MCSSCGGGCGVLNGIAAGKPSQAGKCSPQCCPPQPCCGADNCEPPCCPAPRLRLCCPCPNGCRPRDFSSSCCPDPSCVPLPVCPRKCCPPPCCPQRCLKPSRNTWTCNLPKHCLPPACCAPLPCNRKQCVIISRCSCPAKPVTPDPCCAPCRCAMRLPYARPPMPIPSCCCPQCPPPYGLC